MAEAGEAKGVCAVIYSEKKIGKNEAKFLEMEQTWRTGRKILALSI